MRYREFHFRWEWQFDQSPDRLWPFVADTNRFNRDAGVPAVEENQSSNETVFANASRRLRLFRLGIAVEWDEDPFEWIRPYRFGVVRRYTSGPVAEMRVLVELMPQPGGGTRLVYQVWARPKTLLGMIAIPIQIGWLSARSFAAALRRYDRLAATSKTHFDIPASRASFAPRGHTRLATLRDKLLAGGAADDSVNRLVELIEQADDLTLSRLRPYALADHWGADRRTVLELCLLATRAGLLDLQWDQLCPLCRGAKRSSSTLSDIHPQIHCDSCNINFTVDFDRLVELTFRPNSAVRHVERNEFCMGGPQVTPHIAAQQLLAPGTDRSLTLSLEEGRYRLRTPKIPGGQYVFVTDDGASEAAVRASADGWADDELRLAPRLKLRLENATDSEQLFVVERMAWSDQAATAAEVTALQVFRDLFAREALRPGEQISVGSLTIIFTDLRDSTRLYREIGDATAFGKVLNHFDVLREVIAAEQGAIVKTIGDAVMAVFSRPVAALRAALNAQKALASPSQGEQLLLLKVGIHSGPCIAVTLNDRLDYFGSTVNAAARFESLSSGEDIVISTAVYADPEVADLLSELHASHVAQPSETTLKGFDTERFKVWRVRPISAVVGLPSSPDKCG